MVLLESEKLSIEKIELVEHEISGSSYNPSGSVEGIDRNETDIVSEGSVKYACDTMSLCNDARLIGNDAFVESISDPSPQFYIEGEPTEAALLVVVEKLGPYNPDDAKMPSVLATQNSLHFINSWKRYATLEFDRQRKSM